MTNFFHSKALAQLTPAYFSSVMATGIVSIALHSLGWTTSAWLLFLINVPLYFILWLLYICRLLFYPKHFFYDLSHHIKAPGFFTLVAATNVLGTQTVLLANNIHLGMFLWSLGLSLWFFFTYSIFSLLILRKEKPSLSKSLDGSWLLAIVATQSVAELGILLAQYFNVFWQHAFQFLALTMWLWGGMLYIWIILLIFYRYLFFQMEPKELTPPYWINMGAMAISTLAGTMLIRHATEDTFLYSMLPFIKGMTLFYWSSGTWWIPLLLAFGVWRYIYHRYPYRYSPMYWSVVFPLAMYAESTRRLSDIFSVDSIGLLAQGFAYVSVLAWGIVFFGMLCSVFQTLALSVK